MVIQYLHDNDYVASFLTLQDEANVKVVEQLQQRAQVKAMGVAILGKAPNEVAYIEYSQLNCIFINYNTDGDWTEVEKLCAKQAFSNSDSFLYAVYKQQYLELLERQESQKVIFNISNDSKRKG